jgi:hypothetical protein
MSRRTSHIRLIDIIVDPATQGRLMDADRAPNRSGVEVRRAAAAFAQPIRGQGVLQLLTSFGPFVIACAAMYLVYPIHPLLGLRAPWLTPWEETRGQRVSFRDA